MTTRNESEIDTPSIPSRLVNVLLLMLAQAVAALLIGSVMLAVSPTQAAEAQRTAFIKESDARSGSLP
jgi:hypothetical protein